MANEIKLELGTSGATVYAVARDAAGQAWNGSAFVTYTTTRSTFKLAMTELGVTGFYGPIDLPGSGTGRWWQIYRQVGGSPSHTLDEYWATGYNDDAITDLQPVLDSVSDAISEAHLAATHAGAAQSVAESALTAIGNINAGGTIVPVNQVACPLGRTWILKPRGSGLVGEVPLFATVGEEGQTYAISFQADLPANGRIATLDVLEQISGPDDGIVFSDNDEDFGVDRGEAKLKFSCATSGTYQLSATVSYDAGTGGGGAIGIVTLIVREAA
jgi:hypothetical protein